MILNNHIPATFAVKALACFQAVQMGLDLSFLKVEIEGDALTVVKKLHANRQERSEHALRQGNGVAHLLTTEGIRRGETTYQLEEMPLFVADAVERDRWLTDPLD
ncbi:hypothetical protein Gohar_020342 [Gossypium harknessii]|uniref:RNase H type-1 domain-containing protein n=1 Tax=Gossypium harknessii TaxID=34285 RepID=A0A7J9I028_9ROSI|nr:hypothetical protein [Gossypium harknessii]